MSLRSAPKTVRSTLSLIAALTAFSISCRPQAFGQSEGRAFQEPPEAPRSVNHELRLDLTVGYAYVPILNPANIGEQYFAGTNI